MAVHIAFCTSCRIALGKLRRTTNIASSLKKQNANVSLTLLANSGPKGVLQGLSPEEVAVFDRIEYGPAVEMVDKLKRMSPRVVVVDTMNVPRLHQLDAQLCLILREVVAQEQKKFRLKQNRPWDLIILPHPDGHWMPDGVSARRIEAVGWIYRRPETSGEPDHERNQPARVLITTGGGSGEDRGNDIRSEIAGLLAALHQKSVVPFKTIEIIGPRDWQNKSTRDVDEVLSPGPELHNLLSKSDLVISAAGYNTVLELACTDVPVLLVPVPRYTDDQEKRARLWGGRLGLCYDSAQKDSCIQWMADSLRTRLRRPVVDIGPSGAERAAALIVELSKERN